MSVGTEELPPIDCSKIKLERGPTPPDIKDKCLELCQQYLGGVWLKLTTDEVEVQRLSGGLTNQIYYFTIIEDKQISDSNEVQEVIILLYGEKYFNNLDDETNKRLTDTIISLLISENGLGPKIYGVFEGGQIQKYYKHKSFEIEEQKDIKLVKELAQRLARIHGMDVPIKKSGNWLFHFFDDNYKLANERFDLKALIDKSRSQTLKTYDIGEELQWLKKAIIDSKSPHIFTHVDFRSSNVMITESDDIILCDFEYASYGYRGFDFGTMFCEWGRSYGQWSPSQEFPSDETIKPFIDSYIEESVKLKGMHFIEDMRNSYESLLNEVKLFSLAGYMWAIMFHLPMSQSLIYGIPFNKLQSMKRIENHYNIYQGCKKLFIQQNVFDQGQISDTHRND